MNQLQIPIALIILLRPILLVMQYQANIKIFKSKCWILKLYTITDFGSEANGVPAVNPPFPFYQHLTSSPATSNCAWATKLSILFSKVFLLYLDLQITKGKTADGYGENPH